MGEHKRTNMLPVLETYQYDLIYNCASLGLASMMASTAFFFLRLPSFHEKYRAALCFTGLVTFIAMYHYFRIFNSFEAAYTSCFCGEDGAINHNLCDADKYGYQPTGIAFNDAYRYVDWLLTVPLLLIEIVLVMNLPEEETTTQCFRLGVSSALMIANGYPGESSGDHGRRWLFWSISMAPFCFIVYTLFVGLKEAQESQPAAVKSAVKWACWATVFSWCTYPIVYLFPMFSGNDNGTHGLSAAAMTSPGWLHRLRHHLQVRRWLPRLPHRPQQVAEHGRYRLQQHRGQAHRQQRMLIPSSTNVNLSVNKRYQVS